MGSNVAAPAAENALQPAGMRWNAEGMSRRRLSFSLPRLLQIFAGAAFVDPFVFFLFPLTNGFLSHSLLEELADD